MTTKIKTNNARSAGYRAELDVQVIIGQGHILEPTGDQYVKAAQTALKEGRATVQETAAALKRWRSPSSGSK